MTISPQEYQKVIDRLDELEMFQDRIKLGQRWLLCIFATIGSLIAGIYYLFSTWDLWVKHHT